VAASARVNHHPRMCSLPRAQLLRPRTSAPNAEKLKLSKYAVDAGSTRSHKETK